MRWKDVPGWEGFYQVSDAGWVRSVDRMIRAVDRSGKIGSRFLQGTVLQQGVLKNGYKTVSFTAPGGRREYWYVHDLVLLAFRGPKKKPLECCHRNGIRSENRLTNLRYGTRASNAQDRKRHGAPWPKGEDTGSAKLTDRDIRWIRQNRGVVSMRAMGRKFGVTHKTIAAVLSGETWGHVQ